jgi:uncharacterized protein YecT (DUF1311 family)
MAKTDAINMIEWKQRRGTGRLPSTLVSKLDQLADAWNKKSSDADLFDEFVPMRIVTIIEVFVREVICELVDSDDTYLRRAEQLSKGARLDFAFLSGLQGKKVSVGDFIAHTISINEPARIIAYFDNLIPGFVSKLKASHERWTEDREQWPLKPLIGNYGLMTKQLSKLFSVRHILTHELPMEPPFEHAEIENFLETAKEFVSATDWVMVGELHGAVPRTQLAMNTDATKDMVRQESEMAQLLDAVTEMGGLNIELLNASQSAWQEFSRREADLQASLVEGGSMYSMVWTSSRAQEIQNRIKTLRRLVERQEGDL